MPSMDKIEELLTRGVANIIPSKSSLERLLASGKKLNVYHGIDPTSTQIHLGNAVPLRKLQNFVELGHNVTFLIGDFTALIGDSSDKESARPSLTKEQIKENLKTYKEQASKIVDFDKIAFKYNSSWLSKLKFEEIIKLMMHFTLQQFVSRELVKKRLDKANPIALHETIYPIIQGYDSYYLDTDIQLGGTDQTFNMQAGRVLQQKLRGKESFVITNEFLEGTDGRKMSKSWGNVINISDAPVDMFAEIMAIKDELIIRYFTLSTNVPLEEIEEIKKRFEKGSMSALESKKRLAWEIVKMLNGENEANLAQEHFEKVVQGRATPTGLEKVKVRTGIWNLTDLLAETKLVKSKSEAKRLISEGAIEVNGEKVKDKEIRLWGGEVLKIGKYKFVRLTTKDE